MNNNAPDHEVVRLVAEKYLNNIMTVERVPKGSSTYVYRVTTNSGTYYLRFLPEEGSFATEVLVHNTLYTAGVRVPRVIEFEKRDERTGLSIMLLEEIKGNCLEDDMPQTNLQGILNEAGQQLAIIHSIPVEGFGWIDRSSYNKLKGEKHSFDISHIFHSAGRYSGIIDFGEIRGNSRLFDLATFVGFYQERTAYSYLLEGYSKIIYMTKEDLYAAELMSLFIILRFLGKKVNSNSRGHWYRLAKKQLEQINAACY